MAVVTLPRAYRQAPVTVVEVTPGAVIAAPLVLNQFVLSWDTSIATTPAETPALAVTAMVL